MRLLSPLVRVLLLLAMPTVTQAHPHMWIDAVIDLRLDEEGIAAIDVEWAFDEFSSADLIFSFDDDLDGAFSRGEIATVQRDAFAHLHEVDYFLIAFAGSRRLRMAAASRFTARIDDGRLVYAFRVPVRIGWDEMDDLVVGHFDQSYYIDFLSEPARGEYTAEGRRVVLAQETLRLASDGWGTVRVPALRVEAR
jgi:ABC-type uncharacterized transport system substrate-binding protein